MSGVRVAFFEFDNTWCASCSPGSVDVEGCLQARGDTSAQAGRGFRHSQDIGGLAGEVSCGGSQELGGVDDTSGVCGDVFAEDCRYQQVRAPRVAAQSGMDELSKWVLG